MLVLHCLGLSIALGASRDGLGIDTCGVIDMECDILDSVTVSLELSGEVFAAWVEWGGQSEDNVAISDNMGAKLSAASLKTLYFYDDQ